MPAPAKPNRSTRAERITNWMDHFVPLHVSEDPKERTQAKPRETKPWRGTWRDRQAELQ